METTTNSMRRGTEWSQAELSKPANEEERNNGAKRSQEEPSKPMRRRGAEPQGMRRR